ncbi:MAG: ATP-binding protein [Pseudomonadota bacterium]
MNNKYKEMLLVGLFTAFMGQVNFYPFGTDFRITIGVVVFTFLLLYFHSLPIMPTSVVTGISVLMMRVGIDVFAYSIDIYTTSVKHLPGMMFYMSYGIIIEAAGFRRLFDKPVYFIVTLTTADIMSNFFELIIRQHIGNTSFDRMFSMLMLAAVIRSCLVFALFWIIKYYSLFITKEEHQKRYKELLLLTAKLKSEVFFLKKSMQDIEGAMAKSYSIYNSLKESSTLDNTAYDRLTADCLNLSIDIHEIKKDYNRIVLSMERLMPARDPSESMKVSEIFETIEDIFTRYLEVINKDIHISFETDKNFRTSEYFIIMSILNNMIQNSIEACFRNDSYVKARCFMEADTVVFSIEDNGKGINEKEKELIFEPGYTTKFNPETGQVSTGLGLTHMKMLAEYLDGKVILDNSIQGITVFRLELPVDTVIFEEDEDV